MSGSRGEARSFLKEEEVRRRYESQSYIILLKTALLSIRLGDGINKSHADLKITKARFYPSRRKYNMRHHARKEEEKEEGKNQERLQRSQLSSWLET